MGELRMVLARFNRLLEASIENNVCVNAVINNEIDLEGQVVNVVQKKLLQFTDAAK